MLFRVPYKRFVQYPLGRLRLERPPDHPYLVVDVVDFDAVLRPHVGYHLEDVIVAAVVPIPSVPLRSRSKTSRCSGWGRPGVDLEHPLQLEYRRRVRPQLTLALTQGRSERERQDCLELAMGKSTE